MGFYRPHDPGSTPGPINLFCKLPLIAARLPQRRAQLLSVLCGLAALPYPDAEYGKAASRKNPEEPGLNGFAPDEQDKLRPRHLIGRAERTPTGREKAKPRPLVPPKPRPPQSIVARTYSSPPIIDRGKVVRGQSAPSLIR